jgi:hypothetical protein
MSIYMFIVILFIIGVIYLWRTGKLDTVQAAVGAAFGVIAGWYDTVIAFINGLM